MENSVWIGLLCVSAPPENPVLNGSTGAYVTAIAIAKDESSFFKRATEASIELGLNLEEIVWCEPLEVRLKQYDIAEYLLNIANELKKAGEGCQLGVFHGWDN